MAKSKFFNLRVREADTALFDAVFAVISTKGWSALGVSSNGPVVPITKTNLASYAIQLLAEKADVKAPPASKPAVAKAPAPASKKKK